MTAQPTWESDPVVVESRVAPNDLDAEAAVISAVLVDPAAMPKLEGILRAEHFYSEAHRQIYGAASALRAAGKPVDIRLVATWLRDKDRLAQVGGPAYLTQVLDAAPAVTNVLAYAGTVLEKYRLRQQILIGDKIKVQGYAGISATSAAEELAALQRESTTADELLHGAALAAPLGDLDYLVAELGMVAGGGAPHLVAGFGFSGKTLAVQDLALSLAAGVAVWGVHRARTRRVVHVDLEQGDRTTRRRYQRLARALGIDLTSLGDALAVAIQPPGLTLSPHCEGRWRGLMSGRDLLIVDSLRAAAIGDENASEIRGALDMLGRLAEVTGCRALVIHHARKPSADDPGDAKFSIRGSGAIFDACDGVFVFAADKGEPIRVQNVKARSHGELVDDFALVVSDVDVEHEPRAGLRVHVHGVELVNERRDARRKEAAGQQARVDADVVRRALKEHPGLTMRDLRAAVRPVGRERLEAALFAMKDELEVREEQQGRTKAHRHFLKGGAHV
jgi:hypothetical protein